LGIWEEIDSIRIREDKEGGGEAEIIREQLDSAQDPSTQSRY